MKKVLLFLLFAQGLLAWSDQELISHCVDPEKPWDWSYQSILVNGRVVLEGYGPDGPSRYEAIRSILNKYTRPITVLDIGANNGYFELRILQEFDATCVLVDRVKGLSAICEANTALNHRIIELKTLISLEELKRLSECEHFDVVLIFNLLHHQWSNWQEWVDTALNLGDHLIAEIPPVNDPVSTSPCLKELNDYFSSLPASQVIAYTPRRPGYAALSAMYWVQAPKKSLQRKYWGAPDERVIYSIESDWNKKEITIIKDGASTTRSWMPGINVRTFFQLNGNYPALESKDYGDNTIIQGKELKTLQ